MKLRYRMLIVIVCMFGIILLVDGTREPINPSAYAPIQSLNESHFNQKARRISERPVHTTPLNEDLAKNAIEDDKTEVDAPVNDAPVIDTSEIATSYESIVSHAEAQIEGLQASCQGALITVYFQYMSSKDAAEKKKLIGEGKAKLSSCDASFDGILSNLNDLLTANNRSTAIIETYRTEYEQQKAMAQSMLD